MVMSKQASKKAKVDIQETERSIMVLCILKNCPLNVQVRYIDITLLRISYYLNYSPE